MKAHTAEPLLEVPFRTYEFANRCSYLVVG